MNEIRLVPLNDDCIFMGCRAGGRRVCCAPWPTNHVDRRRDAASPIRLRDNAAHVED